MSRAVHGQLTVAALAGALAIAAAFAALPTGVAWLTWQRRANAALPLTDSRGAG